MKYIIKHFNEEKEFVSEEVFDTFIEVFKHVALRTPQEVCKDSLTYLLVEDDVLLVSSIDDLVYEWNILGIRNHPEVLDFFVETYSNFSSVRQLFTLTDFTDSCYKKFPVDAFKTENYECYAHLRDWDLSTPSFKIVEKDGLHYLSENQKDKEISLTLLSDIKDYYFSLYVCDPKYCSVVISNSLSSFRMYEETELLGLNEELKTYKITKVVSRYEYYKVQAKSPEEAEELSCEIYPYETETINISYSDAQEI